MSLTARICTHHGKPWIVVETPPRYAGGEAVVTYDGPLNMASKATIKAEIDWAHTKTGMPRPDLYDAVRLYQNTQRREGRD